MFSLTHALTLYPRVQTQDAGGSTDTPADIIVERFFVSPHGAEVLLDACVFHLCVVRDGHLEEAIFCTSYDDLEHQLIGSVHGGNELWYGAYWKEA